ncbi:YciI family protein [Mesobacillus sp. AQ2]|uniref:YciI family protein n=1 Tax=Bacillaceae TaxID=186817 RepID=UPI00119E74CD|nr:MULTISPECIES: YciI family protein [Bacillaceae]WHX38463.1 YciI family protein [Mesobacillus sp. AQ2]
MKFLCLGYLSPEKMNVLPKGEIEAIMSECSLHLQKFYLSGQVIMDVGVETEVKSIRREKGNIKVTENALVEFDERIGSVFLIEANDMEEAIRIASLHPTTQFDAGEELGWRIEIRPVHYFEKSE